MQEGWLVGSWGLDTCSPRYLLPLTCATYPCIWRLKLLAFKTTQESLNSRGPCVCTCPWQNFHERVDVLGEETCRLLHAVCSSGQLKFYFHEVTFKQEVGFQKCSLLTEWGWWEEAHGSVELVGL